MMRTVSKNTLLAMSANELWAYLRSSESGLSEDEANARLKAYGPNAIRRKKLSAPSIFSRQLQNSLIYLLAGAAAIAFWIRDYTDGIIILIILCINALLGFFQEYRAERAIAKLAKFITTRTRVKRDGKTILLDRSQIVPGDVITVQEGDIVPADMVLIEVRGLQVNESQLTGESLPVTKQTAKDGVRHMRHIKEAEIAFAGSTVEKGIGKGIVYATGYRTEFGTIAELSAATRRETQYAKSLSAFGALLVKIIAIVLIAVLGLKLFLYRGATSVPELLLFIIALAVGTVPEALPVITTLSLSNGALKLAKKNVVVKRLSAIEDLGNINLLCTDKTGTITENRMTVKKVVAEDSDLFEMLAYASIAPVKNRKNRTENSYDDAFIAYTSSRIKKEAERFCIIQELPFDPEARRRRVVLESATHRKHYLVVIGAPETLMKISHKGHKDHYLQHIQEDGKQGLHHIALAYREIVGYSPDFNILREEHNLIFLGYAGLYDPLRRTAKNALLHARQLGVGVKVLTGDAKEVTGYIGREMGLLQEEQAVLTGEALNKLSEREFSVAVAENDVFARVSPTQKYRIIKALKEHQVVAYQGDGINDAPSLKLADVAIAVNTATDIAKDSADIVVLNESLDVMVNGIKYGRSIFTNINKYIRYAMSNNFGVLIGSSALYFFSASLPILPVQILLNNLLGDVPLTMVSLDSVPVDEIARPQRINIKGLILISLILGIPTALFEILYFMLVKNRPERFVQTSLFIFLTFQALVIFYTIRSKNHFWRAKLPPVPLNAAFLAAFTVSLGIIYIPKFQQWFSFVPLPLSSVMAILGIMAAYFLIADTIKSWCYRIIG